MRNDNTIGLISKWKPFVKRKWSSAKFTYSVQFCKMLVKLFVLLNPCGATGPTPTAYPSLLTDPGDAQPEIIKKLVETNQQQDETIKTLQDEIDNLYIILIVGFLIFGIIIFFLVMKEIMHKRPASEMPVQLNDLGGGLLADQIKIIFTIGQGASGTVELAKWTRRDGMNIDVAVKKFTKTLKKSWEHESKIFDILKSDNETIVKCYLWEEMYGGQQYWILTQYHAHGPVDKYLEKNILTQSELVKFMKSILGALEYLHNGGDRRIKIAHRDIKSQNILVTNYLTCVLADFGLAVSYDELIDKLDMASPGNMLVGTVRYMAPEVLDMSIDMESFDSFTKCDLYSASLVIWESCSRCHLADGSFVEKYKQPFSNNVSANPGVDEMRNVICDRKLKPDKLTCFTNDTVMCTCFGFIGIRQC